MHQISAATVSIPILALSLTSPIALTYRAHQEVQYSTIKKKKNHLTAWPYKKGLHFQKVVISTRKKWNKIKLCSKQRSGIKKRKWRGLFLFIPNWFHISCFTVNYYDEKFTNLVIVLFCKISMFNCLLQLSCLYRQSLGCLFQILNFLYSSSKFIHLLKVWTNQANRIESTRCKSCLSSISWRFFSFSSLIFFSNSSWEESLVPLEDELLSSSKRFFKI